MTAKLDYTFAADALAGKAGIPASVLSALINAESAWNPNAVSSTGATGLGQFTSSTAVTYGLKERIGPGGFDNRRDAALNLTAMVKYLRDLKINNLTWRAVVGHYSGQGPTLAGYARYSAGQALIAAVNAVDLDEALAFGVPGEYVLTGVGAKEYSGEPDLGESEKPALVVVSAVPRSADPTENGR